MNKIFKLSLMVLSLCIMAGCGTVSHKSEKMPTDIGQFRCQDSIQSVFKVLGEKELTEGQSLMTGDPLYSLKYDDLNLWGYIAKASFKLRDDKETIREFESTLYLSQEEVNDLVSQMINTYGQYAESSGVNSDSTTYTWEFNEDTNKYGYTKIRLYITDKAKSEGKEKYVSATFRDGWSLKSDEDYYEYKNKQGEVTIIRQKEYETSAGKISLALSERDNKTTLFISGEVDTKLNALITLTYISGLINLEGKESGIDSVDYYITVNDGTIFMRTNRGMISTVLDSDRNQIELEDYFSKDWVEEVGNVISEDNQYRGEFADCVMDFVGE